MATQAIDEDAAWTAVTNRDRSHDGRFVTGVLSTGIYCRPSCAARHPARRNVRFFTDGARARAAAQRPRPRGEGGERGDQALQDVAVPVLRVSVVHMHACVLPLLLSGRK